MDSTTQELLDRFNVDPTSLSDDELDTLRAGLDAEFERLDGEPDSSEVVQQQTTILDAIDAVDTEKSRRNDEAEQVKAQRDQLRQRRSGDGEGEGEGGEGGAPPAGEGGSGEGGEGEAPPLAAGARRTPLASVTDRNYRRVPNATAKRERATITAAASVDQTVAAPGQVLTEAQAIEALDKVRVRAMRMTMPRGTEQRFYVSKLETPLPPERTLTRDDSPQTIADKLDAAIRERVTVTAAGGFCAPFPVLYDMPVIGDTGRPIRDALAGFNADRGGVRFRRGPKLADVAGAVGIWTSTVDASPGGATKNCIRYVCEPETSASVDAIYTCLIFGNMTARYDPEGVAANTRLVGVNHDRIAENNLLAKMASYMTTVDFTGYGGLGIGATRDVLGQIDVLIAAFRSSKRISENVRLRQAWPFWVKYLIRSDIARSGYVDGDGLQVFSITDQQIEEWFNARGVTPVWHLDGQAAAAAVGTPPGAGAIPAIAAQILGEQATGPVLAFPATVVSHTWIDGDFVFLEGGALDLGIVRDSTLNGTNDYKTFSETSEGVMFRGNYAYKGVHALRPTGAGQVALAAQTATY